VSRKSLWWIGALIVAALAIGAAAWGLQGPLAYARIATGYTAKQTCSCLHVSGRPMESCVTDYPADAIRNVSIAAEGDRVRVAALFGAFKAEAVYEDGFGCRILED
jgi:hypothetical protein